MTDTMLFHIAKNIIAVFLLSLGITPSEGEDSLTVRDVGPHRIFTQQAKAPPELARSLDAGDVLEQLVNYLEHHNALPTAVHFHPYNVEIYVCPCGCGTFLYVSVYHDA